MNDQPKKLYRSRTDKIIAGVCGGLGDYFNMDPLIFRIVFLLLLFAGGSGFWLYIVLAILIPKEPFLSGHGGQSHEHIRENVHEFVADMRQSAQHWAAEAKKMDHGRGWENRRTWLGVIIG